MLEHKIRCVSGQLIDAPRTILDEGAAINVVGATWATLNAEKLPAVEKCTKILRLADGSAKQAAGELTLDLVIPTSAGPFVVPTTFVVMTTTDDWGMLLGKPWKLAMGAVHDYRTDSVFFHRETEWLQVKSDRAEAPRQSPVGFALHTIDADIGQSVPPHNPPLRDRDAKGHIETVLGLVNVGSDLSEAETGRVRELLTQFSDVFATSTAQVSAIKGVCHTFTIKPSAKFPLRARQPPMTTPEQQAACAQADKLLQAGILEYAPAGEVKCVSGTIMVPKRASCSVVEIEELLEKMNVPENTQGDDGVADAQAARSFSDVRPALEYRMVHNFKPLNDGCDSPIWVAEDLNLAIAKQSGKRYTTVLDQLSAFFAIDLAEESRPYATVFIPGRGLMRYRRLPQGCAGSPATQQAVLMSVLGDLVTSGQVTYWMDDICFASDDFDTHATVLESVLQRARDRGVKFSPKKSKVFQTSVVVGGHLIGRAGRRPDPSLVKAIYDWDVFETAMDVLRFANTASYFRDMVPAMATVARPLYEAIKKAAPVSRRRGAIRAALRDTKVALTSEQLDAIRSIKSALASMPVMHPPIYDRDHVFKLAVDACKDGFGLHLYQEHNGSLRSVMFASRRTTAAEAKRHSGTNELAAIKWALEKTRTVIAGHPVIVETDCRAVRGLLSDSSKLAAATARWQEQVAAFTNVVRFVHRPGKDNIVADALSRAKSSQPTSEVIPDDDMFHDIRVLNVDDKTKDLLHKFRDDGLYPVLCHVTGLVKSKSDAISKRAKNFHVRDGRLEFIHASGRVLGVLTEKEGKLQAVITHEQCGHLCRDLTRNELLRTCWWPLMSRHVNEAIKDCAKCRSVGPAFMNYQLRSNRRYRPFHSVAMDYAVLTESEGKRHIIVFVDLATKFVVAYSQSEEPSSASTIKAVTKLGQTYLLPEELICDDHTVFRSETVRVWLRGDSRFGPLPSKPIALSVATAYGHVAIAEASVHQLLQRLRKSHDISLDLLDPKRARDLYTANVPWTTMLDEAISLHNDRKRSDLAGLSPRQLLLGSLDGAQLLDFSDKRVGGMLEDRADVLFDALETYDRSKDKETKPSPMRPCPFKPGDIVAVYNPRYDDTKDTRKKIMRKWVAPLVVASTQRASATVTHIDGSPFATVKLNRLRHWDGVLAHAHEEPTLLDQSAVSDVRGEEGAEPPPMT